MKNHHNVLYQTIFRNIGIKCFYHDLGIKHYENKEVFKMVFKIKVSKNKEIWVAIQNILKLSMVSRWFGTNTLQGHFATMFQKMFLEKPFQWFFTWFYNVFKMFLLNPFDPAPSVTATYLPLDSAISDSDGMSHTS